MSLVAIMDQLAAKLADLPDLEQVVGRLNLDPTPPCIDIYPGDPFDNLDATGFADRNGAYVFTVRARVSTADHVAGQDVLLSWMDADSDTGVAALLEDDQTLNGYAGSVDVESMSGFRHYVDVAGQHAYLGCEWRVRVLPEAS